VRRRKSKAKSIGIVEEPFTIGDCSVVLRNLRPDEYGAVIQECMRRLRDMGIRDAYIAGYSPEALALYGSLGHDSELKCFVYEMGAA
jgi:hypothetical protein